MADQRSQPSPEDWSSKESGANKDDLAPANTGTTATSGDVRKRTSSLEAPKTSSGLVGVRSKLGLKPEAPIDEEHDESEHSNLWWPKIRVSLKEPFAEFWGTFILVLFGDGGVAQVLLSTDQKYAPGGDGFGNYNNINWAWGIGVMLGIYVAGDSGAFINPALTFTNCVLRKLPWRRFPAYFLAQFLGGFIASGVVYLTYLDSIDAYEGVGVRTVPPAKTATASIFCTYPQAQMTTKGMFFDEFVGTAILMFVIFALKDDTNKGQFSASGAWFPLCLFFLIYGIGSCFGYQTGYAINFARDFGPRLMSYAVGYGHEVWSAGNYYFWIPMVAPFLGALFGGLLYDIFIYTGPSPINTPYLGLAKLFTPRQAIKERVEEQNRLGTV